MIDPMDADVALFQQVLAGDSDAADRFARKYSREVFAYCYRRLYHHQKAEDACQETLMKFWKSMYKIQDRSKFKGFLYRIARNCCIDIFRDPRNNPEPDTGNEQSMQKAPDEMVADEEHIAIIKNIIYGFDDNQKDAILLIHYQGLSYKEVSEILDMAEGTVKSTVSRGIQKLSKALQKKGIV